MADAPALAAEEKAALDWLRARMDEMRTTAGAEGFEAAAAQWLRKLLVRLGEVDEDADEPGSRNAGDPDEEARRLVA